MAVIKSGASTDQLTVDPTAKAARATLYDAAGNVIGSNANPLYVENPILPGTLAGWYTTTTFRTVGAASANVNIFSIWNPAASGKTLGVTRLTLQADHTTLLATTVSVVCAHPTAQPTGGTALAVNKISAAYATAVATPLGLASSDGTNGTAITASLGTRVWSQFLTRPPTLAGWFLQDDANMIPGMSDEVPTILAPGDGLVIQTMQVATTGAFYLVNCMWGEYS